MNKISRHQAEQEFQKWCDYKKIKPNKIENNNESAETLIVGIEQGDLVLNEKNEFIYSLIFPIKTEKSEIVLKELIFMPRLRVGQLHNKLQGVKASDADGRILAYITALTNQNSGLLKKLDLEDYNICQSIAIFFL